MGSKNIKHNPIAWAMWANVLCVYASAMMVLGGFLSQFGFRRSGIGIAVMVLGVLVLFVEWPRSARLKGSTIPRLYQYSIANIVDKLGPVARNYFARAIFWLGASIPCFFVFPAIAGALTLAVGALVYFLAAFKGEVWVKLEPQKERARGKVYEAPTRAPPRLTHRGKPEASANATSTASTAVTITAAETTPSTTTSAPSRKAGPDTSAPDRPVPLPPKAAGASSPPAAAPKPAARPVPAPKARAAKPDVFKNWSWEAAADPSSGAVYYINTSTNQTQWDKPAHWDEYVALYGEPNSTYTDA